MRHICSMHATLSRFADAAGGCAGWCAFFPWARCRTSQPSEPANGEDRSQAVEEQRGTLDEKQDKQELEKKVKSVLEPHLVSLKATLTDELQGAMQRLIKGNASSSSSSKWKAQSADLENGAASMESSSFAVRVADAVGEEGLPKAEDLPMVRRPAKRRWTTATGSIGGALSTAMLRVVVPTLLDCDTPATSTVVSAAASEVASDGSEPSRRSSLKDVEAKASRKPRITFQGVEATCGSDADDDEEVQDAGHPRGSDRGSDTSSVVWRADALDVGENLAAEAAAKKGHTSVDSIVALVQTERERWEEEKQALEARAEELKEQLRAMQAVHRPDAEKEALKKEYQDLRKAMKARSRFGAWVCARHMMESEDEETDAEKEELRRKMSELSAKLRAAKAAMGAASSESDVSPSRRSPGPPIRRKH
ncbi:unnamed protein product [Effrenium voratum]|nr:unnamed protein product [Effrenium voratum]